MKLRDVFYQLNLPKSSFTVIRSQIMGPWSWLGIKEPKSIHQTGHKPPIVKGPERSKFSSILEKEHWDLRFRSITDLSLNSIHSRRVKPCMTTKTSDCPSYCHFKKTYKFDPAKATAFPYHCKWSEVTELG